MSLDPAQRFTDLRELGRELLHLAGQRTRITWGLSFGEGVAPEAQPKDTSIAPLGGTLPPEQHMPRWRKAAPWAGLAAVLLSVFGVLQFSRSPPSTFSAARMAAPSVPTLGDAHGPNVAPLEPPLARKEPATPATDSAAPRPRSVLDKPDRLSKLRIRRPEALGGGVRTRPSDSDDAPDWALPNSDPSPSVQPKSRQGSGAALPSGTNGAPIFD
jgi:hypothetical protein